MEQPNMKMPKDAAQVVLWFKGLPQPTGFLTLRDAADKAVEAVCKAMADDRSKSRVTFYYLTAKELGKLGALA